jgi:hypothetical protein
MNRNKILHTGENLRTFLSFFVEQKFFLKTDIVHAWFLRALALTCLLKGFMAWGALLGGYVLPPSFLGENLFSVQRILAFFAVGHLVSAIGLWLLSAWGRVLWIFTVLAESVLSVVSSKMIGITLMVLASDLFLMTAYSLLIVYNVTTRKTGVQLSHTQVRYVP